MTLIKPTSAGTETTHTNTWFLYVIHCGDESLYCGITTDLKRRLEQHQAGKGARYTKGRTPLTLVASWVFENRSQASRAEIAFKKLPRKAKMEVIVKSNVPWNG